MKDQQPDYFVTSHLAQAAEFSAMWHRPVTHASLMLDETQTFDAEKIIRGKLYQAYTRLRAPVIVDDTWLSLEIYGDFPGPFIKPFLQTNDLPALCVLAGQNRRATARTFLGFYDGEHTVTTQGELAGTITESPRGKGGFGWDPVFMPENHSQTFAEMSPAKKNALSMRRLAVEKLRASLERILALLSFSLMELVDYGDFLFERLDTVF